MSEEQAERQPAGGLDRTSADKMRPAIDRERGKRRNLDRERHGQPVEPGTRDPRELDVTEPDAIARMLPDE